MALIKGTCIHQMSPEQLRSQLEKQRVLVPAVHFSDLEKARIFFWDHASLHTRVSEDARRLHGTQCDHFYLKLSGHTIYGLTVDQEGNCYLCAQGSVPRFIPRDDIVVINLEEALPSVKERILQSKERILDAIFS